MLQPGKYYIGDLCYVLHDRWDEFCQLTINGYAVKDGVFTLADGTQFATYTTAYGDGVYDDNYGNSYPVDAGLIGCIRVDDIVESERKNLNLGNVVEFNGWVETSAVDGVISFNNITIDTR